LQKQLLINNINNLFTQGSAFGHSHRGIASCNDFLSRLNASEQAEKICEEFRQNILGDLIKTTSPFLYPFIIEFALIGASVAYLMSNHIGKRYFNIVLAIKVARFIKIVKNVKNY
jgi:hypothetical protein